MSSVKIMVSSHLVESVQQARKKRFMLQDSVEKYNSFVFPDSIKCLVFELFISYLKAQRYNYNYTVKRKLKEPIC